MDTLMFFYTLAILVICIVTAVLSLAAYASSRLVDSSLSMAAAFLFAMPSR